MNDAVHNTSLSDLSASVTGVYKAFRAAAPNAVITVQPSVAMDGGKDAAASAAFLPALGAAVAAANVGAQYYDFGIAFGARIYSNSAFNADGVHPTQLGKAFIAPVISATTSTALNHPAPVFRSMYH